MRVLVNLTFEHWAADGTGAARALKQSATDHLTLDGTRFAYNGAEQTTTVTPPGDNPSTPRYAGTTQDDLVTSTPPPAWGGGAGRRPHRRRDQGRG